MNKDKQNHVALVCHAFVAKLFARMCNKANQGPNFKWSEFADMATEYVESTIHVHVKARTQEAKDEIEAHAKQTANELARDMVKLAGFVQKCPICEQGTCTEVNSESVVDGVTIALKTTMCDWCGSEFATAEQLDWNAAQHRNEVSTSCGN